MFANLSIRTRLIGTMLLLGALMIFIGVRGITAQQDDNSPAVQFERNDDVR